MFGEYAALIITQTLALFVHGLAVEHDGAVDVVHLGDGQVVGQQVDDGAELRSDGDFAQERDAARLVLDGQLEAPLLALRGGVLEGQGVLKGDLQVGDATVRVLIGQAWGQQSPVISLAPALYLDIQLPAGGVLPLPAGLAQEVGLYTVDAAVALDGVTLAAQTLTVLPTDQALLLSAGDSAVRCMLVGGDALLQRRHIWWNFVSSRKERIVQAADDWEAQRMGHVPGETESIPLPERRFKP